MTKVKTEKLNFKPKKFLITRQKSIAEPNMSTEAMAEPNLSTEEMAEQKMSTDEAPADPSMSPEESEEQKMSPEATVEEPKRIKRIERVEVFSYNNSSMFFKFFENDDKEVIGLARNHRVFFNGEKLPRTK